MFVGEPETEVIVCPGEVVQVTICDRFERAGKRVVWLSPEWIVDGDREQVLRLLLVELGAVAKRRAA